jgi:hypothetical protein
MGMTKGRKRVVIRVVLVFLSLLLVLLALNHKRIIHVYQIKS